MRVICDIEANGLEAPDQVWLVVCKDMDTGAVEVFRELTSYQQERERFLRYAQNVTLWVGHNWLGYDYPVLHNLIGLDISDVARCSIDTLTISKLVDYPREKHSVEDYGVEFNLPKGDFNDFSKYSPEMEEYCKRDVDITHLIFKKYVKYINNPDRKPAILLEHQFQLIANSLHDNGFHFNSSRASVLLSKVTQELEALDKEILTAFPPKKNLVREFTPRATKHGTISKTSVPRHLWDRIHDYSVGVTYPIYSWDEFNPSSHKQIISVLNEAGWRPTDKTKTHIDTERELNRLKYRNNRSDELDLTLKSLYSKLEELQRTGWKVSEQNLNTLPESAPAPARLLAKRILLESRRRTLTEWLGIVGEDGRIRGRFQGIGAWTHRMSHTSPNTANIPREFHEDGSVKLLGKELRSLWQAPRNRLLVGVDAEGIQLRIFAHYIDDPEFTDALIRGKKSDKTDPHSLNQRILGDVCKSRQAAKRFIYALLLGGGIGKLAQILSCSEAEARIALDRVLERYTGFQLLKETVFPKDALRGYFIGLDGRAVRIPADTVSGRKHLCMSGYLQNGEAIIMKRAAVQIAPQLPKYNSLFVDLVHDENQFETPNNMTIAIEVAKLAADEIRLAGEYYNLKCPMAGSYYNDDVNDYTIGRNWYTTH